MSVLSDRDINLKLSPSNQTTANAATDTGNDDKAKSQSLQQKAYAPKLGGQAKSGPYVSPSDAIVSPASQKLANFRQRQINKQTNKNPAARTLFARSVSTCSSTPGLDDCEDVSEAQ